MNPRNEEKKVEVYNFILDFMQENGVCPSTAEIAEGVHLAKSNAHRYIVRLQEEGLIEKLGRNQIITSQNAGGYRQIPVIGVIACGKPKLAIEDIMGYLPINKDWLGEGEYFALVAEGDSMIDAGINSGDTVIVRKQDYADNGQIVVAVIYDEQAGEPTATLKRFYKDKERHHYRLHPENIMLEDIIVDSVEVRGVAVKVIKDLI